MTKLHQGVVQSVKAKGNTGKIEGLQLLKRDPVILAFGDKLRRAGIDERE